MKRNTLFVTVFVTAYALLAIVFDTFPRSSFSELERRDLKAFPEFSTESLAAGSFTEGVSAWFSDTEPYRDFFSSLSMEIHGIERLVLSEENSLSFHEAPAMEAGDEYAFGIAAEEEETEDDRKGNRTVSEYTNTITSGEDAKIGNHGIIIMGSGANTRAMMTFRGSATSGTSYANVANKYKQTFGDKVNIYCMVIPTSVEFYCPDKARDKAKPERPVINNIFANLDPDVKPVDVYSAISKHVDEDIYLRTDHHWAPLGAYYAAQELAKTAGVPFKDISNYEKHVAHNYVGSMYAYTKDIAVKKAPEDFVYYTPKDIEYTTTYIKYSLDSTFHVIGESRPVQGQFFVNGVAKDGSGNSYCVFMGGDSKITQIRTATHNGRRMILLKDSFGNAIPGWLFYSFEEIHVIDFRYFTKNLVKYVEDNAITDIVISNNITHAISGVAGKAYQRFLTQGR